MTDEYEEVGKSLGDLIKEAIEEMEPAPPGTYQIEFNDDLSGVREWPVTDPPWVGLGAGLGHEVGGNYMAHAPESLLEVGDLLPEPITPTPEMGPTKMTEEEWLRELARRMTAHAERFGAIDKQVRRELELAARMLNGYAILWENKNKEGRENG